MENTTCEEEKPRTLRLPNWKRNSVIQVLIVLGMAGTGAAMMAAGLLAWVVGEELLLLTGVSAGAVFIAAGGLGFIKCLDLSDSK